MILLFIDAKNIHFTISKFTKQISKRGGGDYNGVLEIYLQNHHVVVKYITEWSLTFLLPISEGFGFGFGICNGSSSDSGSSQATFSSNNNIIASRSTTHKPTRFNQDIFLKIATRDRHWLTLTAVTLQSIRSNNWENPSLIIVNNKELI